MRIVAFTASRADYGLMRPLLDVINDDPEISIVVIAAGTHSSKEHGSTVDQIRADGFITIEVPCTASSDARVGAVGSVALVTHAVGTILSLEPGADVMLVLGDRFETLGAAQAAYLMGVPVAHVHGGEVIAGVFDDGIRHAITKLSSLHLAANESAARRLRERLGEEPARVHVVGALGNWGLDQSASDEDDWRSLREDHPLVRAGSIVVCVHPETNTELGPYIVEPIAAALLRITNRDFIIIDTNADPGGRAIRDMLWSAVHMHSTPRDHVHVTGLDRRRFLALLRRSYCLLGNSSAAYIEAPVLGVPAIDVGTRQMGRPPAPTIWQCAPDAEDILRAYDELQLTTRRVPASDEIAYPPGDPNHVLNLLVSGLSMYSQPKTFYDGDD